MTAAQPKSSTTLKLAWLSSTSSINACSPAAFDVEAALSDASDIAPSPCLV
jgi:hypothetical protein